MMGPHYFGCAGLQRAVCMSFMTCVQWSRVHQCAALRCYLAQCAACFACTGQERVVGFRALGCASSSRPGRTRWQQTSAVWCAHQCTQTCWLRAVCTPVQAEQDRRRAGVRGAPRGAPPALAVRRQRVAVRIARVCARAPDQAQYVFACLHASCCACGRACTCFFMFLVHASAAVPVPAYSTQTGRKAGTALLIRGADQLQPKRPPIPANKA